MKDKKLLVLYLFGVLFIILGICFLFGSIKLYEARENSIKTMSDDADKTLSFMDHAYERVLGEKKYFEKFHKSGNVEKYKQEHARLREDLEKLVEGHKTFYARSINISAAINMLMAVFLLACGIGLLKKKEWARRISLVCVCLGGFYYLYLYYLLYPLAEITQFICNAGHDLNLLVDPDHDPFAGYASADKYVTLKRFIYGYPGIIGHLIVLGIIIGTFWYLNRSVVKDQFKPEDLVRRANAGHL